MAQTTAQVNSNVLKVRGEAVIETVPEDMVITIPINVKGQEYEATSEKLIRTYNDLTDALVKAGLDRDTIKSRALQITKEYDYVSRERKFVGFSGQIQVRIEMHHDTKMLQNIMRTLASDRFQFGYQLGFQLSDQQQDSLAAVAIEKATLDARRKAKMLAGAMDVRLGDIKEINYGYDISGGGVPVYRDRMVMAEAKGGGGNLELNPQELEIRKEVRIIWAIEK